MRAEQLRRGFLPAVHAGGQDSKARQRSRDNAGRAAVILGEKASENRSNADGQSERRTYEAKASSDFASLRIVSPAHSRVSNG